MLTFPPTNVLTLEEESSFQINDSPKTNKTTKTPRKPPRNNHKKIESERRIVASRPAVAVHVDPRQTTAARSLLQPHETICRRFGIETTHCILQRTGGHIMEKRTVDDRRKRENWSECILKRRWESPGYLCCLRALFLRWTATGAGIPRNVACRFRGFITSLTSEVSRQRNRTCCDISFVAHEHCRHCNDYADHSPDSLDNDGLTTAAYADHSPD